MLVFDTFEDSEYHSEASSRLDSINKWCITAIVFHEFLWFFKGRGLQLSKASVKLEEYLAHEKSQFAPNDSDDIRFAATRMKDYHEYNDLVILSVARRMDIPLLSFDEGLNKMARNNAVVVFPR